MASNDGSNVSLVVKWAGKEYSIDNVAISSTVNDLKSAIHAKTNVLPSRQKLLNLRFKVGHLIPVIHLVFIWQLSVLLVEPYSF